MDILSYNLSWMSWNLFLACVGMILGVLMYRVNSTVIKVLFFFLWLIFIPNSIYILTDLSHLAEQFFEISLPLLPVLIIEYLLFVVLGVVTYQIGVSTLERVLKYYKVDSFVISVAVIIVNFTISFGVMIGRFQRTNSWEVFTNPQKVIHDILLSFFTLEHLLFTLLFGFFCNILYFGLKKEPHIQKYEYYIIGRIRSRGKK